MVPCKCVCFFVSAQIQTTERESQSFILPVRLDVKPQSGIFWVRVSPPKIGTLRFLAASQELNPPLGLFKIQWCVIIISLLKWPYIGVKSTICGQTHGDSGWYPMILRHPPFSDAHFFTSRMKKSLLPKVGTVVFGGIGVGILMPSFNAVISIRVSDKDEGKWKRRARAARCELVGWKPFEPKILFGIWQHVVCLVAVLGMWTAG